MTRAQRRSLEKVTKSLVESCVRNALEDVHAGIFPSSYSDVKVVGSDATLGSSQAGSRSYDPCASQPCGPPITSMIQRQRHGGRS